MNILLAVDDSEFTQKNIDYVEDIAKKLGAEVTLLHAVTFPQVIDPEAASVFDSMHEQLVERGKEMLQKYKGK